MLSSRRRPFQMAPANSHTSECAARLRIKSFQPTEGDAPPVSAASFFRSSARLPIPAASIAAILFRSASTSAGSAGQGNLAILHQNAPAGIEQPRLPGRPQPRQVE